MLGHPVYTRLLIMRRRLTKVITVMVKGFSGTSRFLHRIHRYDRWSSIMNFRRARHLVRRIRWTGSRTLNIVAHLESANENFLFTTLHTSKWNSKAIFLKLKLSGRKFEVFLENQFLSLDSTNWRETNFTNFWVKKSSNWRETNFSDFLGKKIVKL